ncbi:hypothetical protein EBZ35_02880 [bacterium]|nr:hypothetical protein [bacterium]
MTNQPVETKELKSIEDAIRHLSKKRHVISDTAMRAKSEQVSAKPSRVPDAPPSASIIEEFNHSVSLLLGFVSHTQLDEVAHIASSPARVLLINLLMGVIRGIGFGIGALLIAGITFVMVANRLPAGWVSRFVALF